jgi:hypothetical protein
MKSESNYGSRDFLAIVEVASNGNDYSCTTQCKKIGAIKFGIDENKKKSD